MLPLIWSLMAPSTAAEQFRASSSAQKMFDAALQGPVGQPGMLNGAGSLSDEFLQELADQMTEEGLWETEVELVGFGTRFTFREENLAAADWLYEKLSSFGLEVEFMDDYSFSGWPIRNVIGTIRGSVEPERVVVLSGHFDTVVFSAENNVYSDAPGADDNTTAVATVL